MNFAGEKKHHELPIVENYQKFMPMGVSSNEQ